MNNTNIELARSNMIEQQIRPWDVLDPKILDTFEKVSREHFVAEDQKDMAFMDFEIPLGHDEYMLSPKIEGRILQALDLRPTDSVLEIGTGSGYLTACLAHLSSAVFSVELHQDLTDQAKARLESQSIDNVTLWTGDAAHGWLKAPKYYDVIVVTGSIPSYDQCFEQQLKVGGRLLLVVGNAPVMQAMLITKISESSFSRESLFETVLKPLVGRERKNVFQL